MEHPTDINVFDWERILLYYSPYYLLEVAFRSFIMFFLVLLFLRISGKRGIKQLSFFELAVIITLGSAAGDPMLEADAPFLPSIVSFAIVILIYKGLMWIMSNSKKSELILEGKPVCLLENGVIQIQNFDKEDIAYDEFFSQLRLQNVEHLGQVKRVYIETSAEMSIYYFPDEEVKQGLPIWPELYETYLEQINIEGFYACTICGHVQHLPVGGTACANCRKNKWLKTLSTKRIT